MKHTKESIMELVHGIAGYLTSKEQVEAALNEVFTERDELLAALKALLAITDSVNLHGPATGDARAAIAKTEGEKA
jgi:hypothetical protein